MTKRQYTILALFSLLVIVGCGGPTSEDFQPADASASVGASDPDDDGFVWQTEQFADLKIVRYQIPGWEQLFSTSASVSVLLEHGWN